MLAIAANSFDKPSETFIRAHVRHIAPERTVVLCWQDRGAAALGCPVLSDMRGFARARSPVERVSNALRFRWWRYVDPTLRGAGEARVRAFLQRHGVQAVLAEYGPNGSLLRVACKRAGVPLYVHFHGFDATKLAQDANWRRHYRALFRDAAGIIAPSEFLAGRLSKLGCPSGKLHVSRNGVDISAFAETTRERRRIVAIGRLVEKKAPHLTIRAFAKVRSRLPDCTLDMVGEGPLEDACIEEISRHDIGDSVRLHGAKGTDFVRGLLGRADLFVQHSVTAADGDPEGFHVSIVEAMASSVPVVITDHNGFSETIADGETGLLVEEHDVEAVSYTHLTLPTIYSV